ncbi:trimeric intracellular cation channel family protein [Nocardioides sp. Kera G14]|uniref:trimeric intracellular cation channel family protein n=1 Tax=Nocardioides sp. Kera G14 TaxID=2884264 RepID=UPI001D12CA3A|nr:trimeric intracellular cation channel family protein [Nocardioides sp. Kera G14]UDY22372.1 trimeric intracellular cation channel family protein [Nocardioides sp. Kera G14]
MTTDPSLLIEIFDLVGIFVYGLAGGLVAVNRSMDIFGVLVLASVTGLGGGIMRDVLIDATPPVALTDWKLLAAVGFAGLLVFFFHPTVSRAESTIDVIDAVGLSLFSISGSFKAYDYGLSPVASILMGLMTAVGGGVIRDLLSDRVPDIFRGTLYATPAAAGAAVAIVGLETGASEGAAALVGGVVCVVWRLLALYRDWHAPMPRPVSEAWQKAPRSLGPAPGRRWRTRVAGRGDRAARRTR